jgi:hypothetical protein
MEGGSSSTSTRGALTMIRPSPETAAQLPDVGHALWPCTHCEINGVGDGLPVDYPGAPTRARMSA